jgi:squalene-associated FAD-dependent desaturase
VANQSQVIIVGGGLAGLAAAAALAVRGVRVTLFESRPRWGGRASSFVDQVSGETIDNCQHVAMGCCTNFRHFCRLVEIDDLFRTEPRLWFVEPRGRWSQMAAAPLPAPLHLFPSLLTLRHLSWRDKWSLARGLRALARAKQEAVRGQSFDLWLKAHRQTPNAIERFWHVVLVSALSESLDRIDVWQARKVFVDGFLANRDGWQVRIPTAPLSEIYGSRLVKWLAEHGVSLRIPEGVSRLLVDGETARGVELRTGEQVSAEQVVLAVPWHLVGGLFPDELRSHPRLQAVELLEAAPISSVHLWFDKPVMPLPHAALIGGLAQWVFNRDAIQGHRDEQQHYYQVVVSASRGLAPMTNDQIIEQVVGELRSAWPDAATVKLLRGRVVTEHKAVFSPLPGADERRPLQQSFVPNVQFAGDWTQTGWPATMEGAVRSGYLAAENVLRNLGRSERILQPDLPTAWLSQLLFGLDKSPPPDG